MCEEKLEEVDKIAQSKIDEGIDKAKWMILVKNKKRFIYQRRKWFVNKIDYMRWTQAWTYYSLTYYINFRSGLTHE